MIARSASLLAGMLMLAACARPAAVRDVATLSMPMAVQIQTDGGALQKRFDQQRRIFADRASNLARQQADAKAQVDRKERDWKMLDDKAHLASLDVIRSNDVLLLADPLKALQEPQADSSKAAKIDLASLKIVITNLDHLRGKTGSSFKDLLIFADGVKAEVDKLKDQDPAKDAAPGGKE